MRKLDLSDMHVDYTTENTDGVLSTTTVPIRVRTSLINLLFADQGQGTGLSYDEAVARQDLAQRIRKEPATFLLIEEDDFRRLLSSIEAFHNFTLFTIPLAQRVKQTLEVKVQEAAS